MTDLFVRPDESKSYQWRFFPDDRDACNVHFEELCRVPRLEQGHKSQIEDGSMTINQLISLQRLILSFLQHLTKSIELFNVFHTTSFQVLISKAEEISSSLSTLVCSAEWISSKLGNVKLRSGVPGSSDLDIFKTVLKNIILITAQIRTKYSSLKWNIDQSRKACRWIFLPPD